MTTLINKSKRAWRSFRIYWDTEIKTKVKHLVISMALLIFVNIMVQIQLKTLNEARADDIEQRQYENCITRVDTRETLRTLLSGVYEDVYYLLPNDPTAQAFYQRGIDRINTQYPSLDKAECDAFLGDS